MRQAFAGQLYLDPITNTWKTPAPSELMAVDHIVPVKTIVGMPGFKDLTPDQMKAIVQDQVGMGNLQLLPQHLNASKSSKFGERPWSEYKGEPLHPEYIRDLQQRQMDLAEVIKDQINSYLMQNRRAM